MIIIGITGGKGSGKDTASKYLADRYGARTYAIAEPLKQLAAAALGLSHEQLYGTQAQKEAIDPRFDLSSREILQRLGEGVRQAFGEDALIERALAEIRTQRPSLAVISDVRRCNEADRLWLEGHRGTPHRSYLWKLHYAPGLQVGGDPDPTETEWRHIVADLEITPGAGGLSELYAALDDACQLFGISRWDAGGVA